MSSDYRISDEEWQQRELCSDGNCIGVIGPDGRCKECGKPGTGGVQTVAEADSIHGEPVAEDASDDVDGEAADTREAADDYDEDDWDKRRLCPDGNCIGVIGPDGRCKECGRLDE